MTKYPTILVFVMILACSPRVQIQQKEGTSQVAYEYIAGREFKVMENSIARSDRHFTAHYYLKVIGLNNAEIALNDLERTLEADGYQHVASTKNALTALLYKKKTAKFIFFNDAKNKQVDLWFDRVFPASDRYLKGVDLHITIRVLASDQSSPETSGINF